jgi:pimeloyl-ACP methyl ester carboxylesterase
VTCTTTTVPPWTANLPCRIFRSSAPSFLAQTSFRMVEKGRKGNSSGVFRISSTSVSYAWARRSKPGFNDFKRHVEILAAFDDVVRVDHAIASHVIAVLVFHWVAAGAYDTMDERVRAPVTAGMAKLRDEWPTAFEAQGATLHALACLGMPIQLIAGGKTTAAAQGVIEVLRSIWPSAEYAEIASASHMSPVTHAERVNEFIERFLETHTDRT